MKGSDLSKAIGAGVLTLSMAVMPLTLPASAQNNSPDGTGNTAPNTTVDTAPTTGVADTTDDDGFDWDWLGLLGLIGLAGLAGKKRQEPTRYRDPDVAGTPGYRE